MIKMIIKSNALWLMLFLITGGFISLLTKYELLWDFANYHYYNPWAFLNDRLMYDIIPAGVNTFLNPLVDIPLYLLIQNFNDYPNFITFLQGMWSGAAAFAFWLFVKNYFNISDIKGLSLAILALAIGTTSWAFFMQIGTSTNEMKMVLLVMLAYTILVKQIKQETSGKYAAFFLSGFLLGLAAGLKLTAIIYCVSGGSTLIMCAKYFKPFHKLLGMFVLGGLIGFLLTNGFWMWRMWDTFGNPIYPFLNNIFKSEWFGEYSFRDVKYLPTTFAQALFYPFYIMLGIIRGEGKGMIIMDFRNLFMMIIFYCFVIYQIVHFIRFKKFKISTPANTFLWVLWFASYTVWLLLFSIQRYATQIFMLEAIIFVQTCIFLYPKQGNFKFIIYTSVSVWILYSLLFTPHYSDHWGNHINKYPTRSLAFAEIWPELDDSVKRVKNYGNFTKFFDVEDIHLPDNTLLQMYYMPSAAMLPVLNKHSNVRGISLHFDGYATENNTFSAGKWLQLKEDIIKNHKGPKAIMLINTSQVQKHDIFYKYAKSQGMQCHIIANNVIEWVLCVPKKYVKSVFTEKKHEKK
ncbi:MAG: hypothetical protein E7018_00795 [Alphaproteobacteria bacterium]|nr:hypothetical protein [Alphaproteobacteria bacterium]